MNGRSNKNGCSGAVLPRGDYLIRASILELPRVFFGLDAHPFFSSRLLMITTKIRSHPDVRRGSRPAGLGLGTQRHSDAAACAGLIQKKLT